MKQSFTLFGGDSAHVFDGLAQRMRESCIVYRIGIDQFEGAELKIITEGVTRMLTPADTLPMIDVQISRHLYLQAVGKGSVTGWFVLLNGSAG